MEPTVTQECLDEKEISSDEWHARRVAAEVARLTIQSNDKRVDVAVAVLTHLNEEVNGDRDLLKAAKEVVLKYLKPEEAK